MLQPGRRGIDAMEAYIGDTVENDAERNRIAAEAWDDLQNGAVRNNGRKQNVQKCASIKPC